MNSVRCASCQSQTGLTYAPRLRTRIYHSVWCAQEPAISPQNEERDDMIATLLDLGRGQLYIARLFKVSRQRVSKIGQMRRLAGDIYLA